MDTYRIDSHKLMLHPKRVSDWLEGKNIAPLYIEISPSGACNHRCFFCGLDFMGYKPRFLPTDLLLERLQEMAQAGVKSIMYAGEGEPFLHKDMARIAVATRQAGIDVAFTTNATLLKPEISRQILPVTSWIKVSCNAGTPDVYAQVHGTKAADFHKVFDNMAQAVRIREEQASPCTLGFQMVLLPENQDTALALAQRVKDIGADYLVIKPYSHHPQSINDKYAAIRYADHEKLAHELAACNSEHFTVIFRQASMHVWDAQYKPYNNCLAFPFWSYIDAGGSVWGCSVFLCDAHFDYGNILEKSFMDIWNGKQRQESLQWCTSNLDPHRCRVNCRMDAINRYLWELTHPGGHVNFI